MALSNEIDLTVEQLPQNPITLTPIDETDYNNLVGKPKVNSVILEGNKTSAQLGLASAEQGAKADSAVQPADLSVYRTSAEQDVIDEGKVTKAGTETITGQKTFTKPLQLSLSLTDPVDIIDVTDTDLHGNMTLSSDYASSGMFTYLVSHNHASNYDATLSLFNNDMGAFALSLTGSGNAENLSLSGADSSTSSTVIPTKGWVNKYKQDTISDLETIRSGAALGATAVQPSQLANKADTDLSNVPASKGILVESYVNGTSWYRVYSDGWCEQGGQVNTDTSVTYLKPYINNNYTLIASGITTSAYPAQYNQIMPNVKTTTGFTGTTGSGVTLLWLANGYIR